MTNLEILEKAFRVATDRGWEFDNLDKWLVKAVRDEYSVMTNWYQYLFEYDGIYRAIDAERIIFDHDFAKALWPPKELNGLGPIIEEPTVGYTNIKREKPYKWGVLELALETYLERWQKHLALMVIAEDPIKYLGEHL